MVRGSKKNRGTGLLTIEFRSKLFTPPYSWVPENDPDVNWDSDPTDRGITKTYADFQLTEYLQTCPSIEFRVVPYVKE